MPTNPRKVFALILGPSGISPDRSYYLATDGFVTDAADSPANTYFQGRVAEPPEFQRQVSTFFWGGGESGISIGSIEVINDDGGLDDLLTDIERDTQARLYVGVIGDQFEQTGLSGSPIIGEWTLAAHAVVDKVEAPSRHRIRLFLSDRSALFDRPIQTTLYDGAGSTSLDGRPKPIALGQPFSCPVPLVEPSTLDFDVHDGPFKDVAAVHDQAVFLTEGSGWQLSTNASINGFTKLASIAGLVTAKVEGGLDLEPDLLTGIGSPFTFTGSPIVDPDSWTTNAGDASNYVTEGAAGGCRFVAANDAQVLQLINDVATVAEEQLYYYEFTVTDYNSGTLLFGRQGGGFSTDQTVTAAGTYRGTFTRSLGSAQSRPAFRVNSGAVADVTVNNLTIQLATLIERLPLWIEYLANRAGITDLDTVAINALDADAPYALALWLDQPTTIAQVLTMTMDSFGGWWYFDRNNNLTVGRLTAPTALSESPSVAVLNITDDLILGGPSSVRIRRDYSPGLSNVIALRRNWHALTQAEIAGSVSAANRELQSADYRIRKTSTTPLPNWIEASIGGRGNDAGIGVGTLLTQAADGQTEVDRWGALYAQDRFFYELDVAIDRDDLAVDLLTLEPGDIVTLTISRFGFDGGANLIVIGLNMKFLGNQATLTLWG